MKEEENNNYYDNIISDNIASEEISFSGQSQNFCICFVDMVNSTKIIQNISDAGEIRKYYSIFINTIAAIARNFGANIIKNIGDCLIFYYPKTSDSTDKSAFKDVIDCVLTILYISVPIRS
jgi:two-component system, OmpR family, response regulator ChvI